MNSQLHTARDSLKSGRQTHRDTFWRGKVLSASENGSSRAAAVCLNQRHADRYRSVDRIAGAELTNGVA
ncbi:MAG: hypothetical protein ACK5X0_18550 [Rhodospirillales bacterium]